MECKISPWKISHISFKMMLGFDDPFLIEMVPFEETLVNFWEVYRNRILCWSIPSFTNRDFFGTYPPPRKLTNVPELGPFVSGNESNESPSNHQFLGDMVSFWDAKKPLSNDFQTSTRFLSLSILMFQMILVSALISSSHSLHPETGGV